MIAGEPEVRGACLMERRVALPNRRCNEALQAMASTALRAAWMARWARRMRVLAGVLLCAVPTAMTEAAVPGIAQYLWQSRVLLLFAPDKDDPALMRQRGLLAGAGAAMGERDLVLVEVIGPGDPALRRRFGADAGHFRAVLVGKDGGAKLSSAEPLPADRLIEVIDAMPMRRGEAASRRPGGP